MRYLLAVVTLVLAPAAAQSSWRFESGPGSTTNGLAYDEARSELVALGFDDTWTHDGNRWQRHESPAALRNRQEPQLAFDEVSRQVVLFGGRVGTAAVGETWTWDGAQWTLVDNTPALATPRGSMTFDPSRGRLVRHGTFQAGGFRMWEWDGTNWLQIGLGNGLVHDIVYDRANGKLLGHEGFGFYEWSGSSWVGPPLPVLPVGADRVIYDRARQELIGLRGDGYTFQVYRDTGAGFVLAATTAAPADREHLGLTYDTSTETVVLHGGTDNPGYPDRTDTWDWDGVQWTEREPAPSLRSLAFAPLYRNVVHDPVRDRVVLYQSSYFGPGEAGFIEWDGARWTRLAGLAPIPVGAFGPLLWDSVRQRLLLVTRSGSGPIRVWTFDGSAWVEIVTTNPPPHRPGFECAFDAANDQVVLFDGGVLGSPETWLFDGTDWQQSNPAVSPTTSLNAMVYDPLRQLVVLFSTTGKTWVWNGTTWAFRPTPTALHSRLGFAMAWDETRGKVVLTGGAVPQTQLRNYTLRAAQLWEWDGSWTLSSDPVPQSLCASLVSTDDGLLLLGGAQPIQTSALRRLVNDPLAATTTYGVGCPGSLGVPILDPTFVPYLGHATFGVRLTSVPANVLTSVAFGLLPDNTALGNGCTALVAGPLAVDVTVSDPGGAARFALPIPTDPTFIGTRIYSQGAALDPAGALGGIAVSAASEMVIGN